jgi:hypothetical protein
MSEVKVNKVSPRSGTGVQLGDSGDTITVPSGASIALPNTSVANAALQGSGQITINGQAVALGGSITLTTETRPTFSSITPSTIENTQTTCTIAVLTVSDAPAWQTAAGSLGSFSAGDTISTITITATNATSFAVQSGSLPTGLSLNTGSGSATITGTVSSGITSDTLFSFTVRATDAEAQTADRAFTIQITVGANNSGQFN